MNVLINKYKNLSGTVRASFWFLVATFFQRGISVITTPIFTRLMSTAEYGQYNVFLSWMDIFTIFVSLKLYAGVFSAGYVKFEENRNKFAASLQGLCFTLTLIWVVIYIVFKDIFNQMTSLSTVQTFAMFSMIWTTSIFSFWSVEQRTDNKYIQLIVVTIIVSVLKPLLGIILVTNTDDKVTSRILGLAVVEFIVYIALFIRDIYKGKTFFDKKYWLYALGFNIPLIPHYLSMAILNSSDRIMIKKLVGKSAAGIYGLAYSISMIMTLFNTALIQTLEPWIFKKIKNKATRDIDKVVYMAMAIIAIVNIILIAFAPEAVRIFAPKEYYDAIWVIPPVAMSVFFMFSYSMFATFEFYYEKKKYISISTLCGAMTNIVLNYIFIKIFGYQAAGYTTLVCYMIYALLHYFVMRKVCKEELKEKVFDEKMLMLISGTFLGLGFILLITYNSIYVRYSIIVLLIIVTICNYKRIRNVIKMMIETKKEKQ